MIEGYDLKKEAIESSVLSDKVKEYLFWKNNHSPVLITSISTAHMGLTESNTSSVIIAAGSAYVYFSEQP